MADPSRTTSRTSTRPTGRRSVEEPRPSALNRYLLDSEQLVFAVRRHCTVLAGATSVYVVVLSLAFLFLGFADGSDVIATTGLIVFLVGSLWFGWKVGDWWVERFTVTDRRVLLVSGLLTRRVAIMPLRKVTDLTFERSFAGRVFGYGAFVMESAGQQQALSRIDFLPRPESLYLQMSDLLFGRGGADHDPDEDGDDRSGRRSRDRRAPAEPDPRRRPAPPSLSPQPLSPQPLSSRHPTARPPVVPRPPGSTTRHIPAGGTEPPPLQQQPPPSPTPRTPMPAPMPAPARTPAGAPGPASAATTPLPSIARDRAVSRRPRGRQGPEPR